MKAIRFKYNISQIITAVILIGAGIALSLLRHWEPTGESWGSWLFARIFAETGRFVIFERSPLYTLYLNLFRWMGYPTAVIVEYIATISITATSLVFLFRRHMGLSWAAIAVFFWLPFLQFAEPPVQNLALACSCLAIVARGRKNRFSLAISYCLMGLAYMFRCTYIVFIFIFVIWDSIKIFRQQKLKGLILAMRPKLAHWPVILILILAAWFNIMQSPHSWNNASTFTAKWAPGDWKTLSQSAFIQNYNWQYIYYKYGNPQGHDFYFTNQEVFNGAKDMLGAIRANPKFVVKQALRNIKGTIGIATHLTMVPRLYKPFSILGLYPIIALLFIISSMLAVFYGALRICKNNKTMILFLIANIFLTATTVLSVPKSRYMHPIIPIFILGAFWLGRSVSDSLKKKGVKYLVIPAFLIFFSGGLGVTNWRLAGKDIFNDARNNEIKIMERRLFSYEDFGSRSHKVSFRQIETLIENCKGVLSLEHKFFGAFSNKPLATFYDIWEIPPFGKLTDSDYEGLKPERIDCVLVSNNLVNGETWATNAQIRYDNYIKPYVKQLKKKGAKVHEIDRFGQVVILSREGM